VQRVALLVLQHEHEVVDVLSQTVALIDDLLDLVETAAGVDLLDVHVEREREVVDQLPPGQFRSARPLVDDLGRESDVVQFDQIFLLHPEHEETFEEMRLLLRDLVQQLFVDVDFLGVVFPVRVRLLTL